jgi:hypothetical protein
VVVRFLLDVKMESALSKRAGVAGEPGDNIHAQCTSNVCRRFGHASAFSPAHIKLLKVFRPFANAKLECMGGTMMKPISNLIFVLSIVGMSGFWTLALTGHLALPSSALTTGAQPSAQESTATVAPPADKELGGQKDNEVGAVSAPIEKVSAPIEEVSAPPAPAKTKALASKSEKHRPKKPVQVKTKDRAASDKS